MFKTKTSAKQANRLWELIGGNPDQLVQLKFSNSETQFLPSVFDLTGFASASVGVATLATAVLAAARRKETELALVEVNSLEACAAFKRDSILKPAGWTLPPLWDPLAGDYRCANGWIRLHTNYLSHKNAALQVVKSDSATRSDVEKKVASWQTSELEAAIVSTGGCAAVLNSRDI